MTKSMNFAPKEQPELGKFPLRDKLAMALFKIKKASKKKGVLQGRSLSARGGTTGGVVKNATLHPSLKNQLGTGSSGRIQ